MNPETRLGRAQLPGTIQIGAAAALLIAAILPLMSFAGLINIGLGGGSLAYALGLAVAVAGLVTLALTGRVNALLTVGTWILAGLLAINIVVVFAILAGAGDPLVLSPNAGLILAIAVGGRRGRRGRVPHQAERPPAPPIA